MSFPIFFQFNVFSNDNVMRSISHDKMLREFLQYPDVLFDKTDFNNEKGQRKQEKRRLQRTQDLVIIR